MYLSGYFLQLISVTETWSYSFCPCHTGSFCIAKGSVFKDASEVLFWVWKNRTDKNDSLFIWCFTGLRTCADVAHCPQWPGSQPEQVVAYHLQKSIWRQGGFNSLPNSLCFSSSWLRGSCSYLGGRDLPVVLTLSVHCYVGFMLFPSLKCWWWTISHTVDLSKSLSFPSFWGHHLFTLQTEQVLFIHFCPYSSSVSCVLHCKSHHHGRLN